MSIFEVISTTDEGGIVRDEYCTGDGLEGFNDEDDEEIDELNPEQ
ncbi:hypothetical protein EWM64_g9091 [Hericium alpestre]|uniref:Uncharacterized protein n=1 Tax=Hericium alpestre TaxID=135208 RepID=A0A4Y9ZM64_9AGAM|nr:hypothetical protein EWM64_g9091 [Hericium alpestre]